MRLTKLPHALVTAFVAILPAVTALTAQQKNPLSNADVIKMVKAGMAENTIAAAIAANDTQFDLSSNGLQTLSQAGVSSKVIRAMLAAESKKKDAAAAAENSTPRQDSSTAQGSAPDASSGMGPQGMSLQGMPHGMSSDQMQQMMNNMPPECGSACKPRWPSATQGGPQGEEDRLALPTPFHLMAMCRFHWIARSMLHSCG
jgi:hypothetical protein